MIGTDGAADACFVAGRRHRHLVTYPEPGCSAIAKIKADFLVETGGSIRDEQHFEHRDEALRPPRRNLRRSEPMDAEACEVDGAVKLQCACDAPIPDVGRRGAFANAA